MRCVEQFEKLYNTEPDGVSFCPYRVSPLGAHIDHQLGKVNGLALDRGIHFAYRRKTKGICELYSLDFPEKRAQFHVMSVPEEKQNDWADHLRGAAMMLGEKFTLRYGVAGILEGSMPIGGLSSSAAVIIAFLLALCKVNGITLSEWELILMAKAAENRYVGVNCGKLDQSCEVLCRKGHLLYLDTKDDSFELIPTPENMPEYKIAVFFSGLNRSLKNSAYNARADECKAASYALKAFAGMPYGKFEETVLRDVPQGVFEKFSSSLPEAWAKRARHYYTEMARAEAGAEAWRRGDLAAYGKLVFESGASSVHNYESGCPELIRLYEIMTETDGIYGGRFSGAGFKGCCMALIDPSFAVSIEQKVTDKYLADFPALAGKFSVTICESGDGVEL